MLRACRARVKQAQSKINSTRVTERGAGLGTGSNGLKDETLGNAKERPVQVVSGLHGNQINEKDSQDKSVSLSVFLARSSSFPRSQWGRLHGYIFLTAPGRNVASCNVAITDKVHPYYAEGPAPRGVGTLLPPHILLLRRVTTVAGA